MRYWGRMCIGAFVNTLFNRKCWMNYTGGVENYVVVFLFLFCLFFSLCSILFQSFFKPITSLSSFFIFFLWLFLFPSPLFLVPFIFISTLLSNYDEIADEVHKCFVKFWKPLVCYSLAIVYTMRWSRVTNSVKHFWSNFFKGMCKFVCFFVCASYCLCLIGLCPVSWISTDFKAAMYPITSQIKRRNGSYK